MFTAHSFCQMATLIHSSEQRVVCAAPGIQTYPTLLRKYGETACTAVPRTDGLPVSFLAACKNSHLFVGETEPALVA